MFDKLFAPKPPDMWRDFRPKTTGWVWFFATIMLGLTIPMVGATGSLLAPFAVLGASALSTCGIWFFGAVGKIRARRAELEIAGRSSEHAALIDKVADLENRLSAMETIDRFESSRAGLPVDQGRFEATRSPHTGADPLAH